MTPKATPSQVHLLERVLRVERDLREIIRTVFEHEREDWESLIPSAFRQRLERDRERAQVPWGPERSSELLAFASLSELADILAGRWKFFQDVFGEKPILMAKLDELRLFRNAIAHGAELTEDDRLRLRLLVEDVERRIPELVKKRTSEVETAAGKHLSATDSERNSAPNLDGVRDRIRSRHVRSALNWMLTEGGFQVIGGYPRRVRFPITLRVRRDSNINARVELGQVAMRVNFPEHNIHMTIRHQDDVNVLKNEVRQLGRS